MATLSTLSPSQPPSVPPRPNLTNLNANILRRCISKDNPITPIRYNLSQLKTLCDNSNKQYSETPTPILSDKNIERVLTELETKLEQQMAEHKFHGALQQDKLNPKNMSIAQIIDKGMEYFEQETIGFFRQHLDISKSEFNKQFQQAISIKARGRNNRQEKVSRKDYAKIVRSCILEREGGGGADAYELANEFYKLDKNTLWSILSFQLSGGTQNTLQQVAHNTLKLIQNIFKQIVPIKSSLFQINNYLKKQVLSLNSFNVISDKNNLNTFAILYVLLKTGQFDRIQELSLNEDISFAFTQFFKYAEPCQDVDIPRVNDIFLQEIQDIMRGRSGDPRLVEDNVDFAWRSLTLFTKHSSHSKEELQSYQKKIVSELKKAHPSDYQVLTIHLIYSLNYTFLVQLPNDILNIETRMHIGLVIYSAHLLPKSVFIELVREYLDSSVDVKTIVDYSLLLEDEELILSSIAWCLVRNYKIEEFFGLNQSMLVEEGSQYLRLSQYFDQGKYRKFAESLLKSNQQLNSLSTAILYCKILQNIDQALLILLKQQIVSAKLFKLAVTIIQNDPRITPTQTQILKFIRFYKESIEMTLSGDIARLSSTYKHYLTVSRDHLTPVIDFLFQNHQAQVFLNYIKIKILYVEKAEEKPFAVDVEGDFNYYKERVKGRGIRSYTQTVLVEEIQDYLY